MACDRLHCNDTIGPCDDCPNTGRPGGSIISTVTLTAKDTSTLTAVRTQVAEAEAVMDCAIRARRKAVVGAAKRGATMREIAEAVGISHQRVAQILNG